MKRTLVAVAAGMFTGSLAFATPVSGYETNAAAEAFGSTVCPTVPVSGEIPTPQVTVLADLNEVAPDEGRLVFVFLDSDGNEFGSPIVVENAFGTTEDYPTASGSYQTEGWFVDEGFLQLDTNENPLTVVVRFSVGGVDFQSDPEAVGAVMGYQCVGVQPPEGSIEGSGATVVCVLDAPYIDYSIETRGLAWPDEATLSFFTNAVPSLPVGDPVTVRTQQGQIVYPGAEVDENGRGIDWPGWKQDDAGNWIEDPSDAFLRDGLRIVFEVNPTAEAVVLYPPANAACYGPDRPQVQQPPGGGGTGSRPLPSAGVDGIDVTIRLAALALIGGVGILVVSRRRRVMVTH